MELIQMVACILPRLTPDFFLRFLRFPESRYGGFLFQLQEKNYTPQKKGAMILESLGTAVIWDN